MVEWVRRWKVEELKRWGYVNFTLQEGVLTFKEEKFGEKGRGKRSE